MFIQSLTPFLDSRYNKINRPPEKNRFVDTEKTKLQKAKFLAKEHKEAIIKPRQNPTYNNKGKDLVYTQLPTIQQVSQRIILAQNGSILRVIKPLCRVPEAGNHWFNTYYQHYIKELQIS